MAGGAPGHRRAGGGRSALTIPNTGKTPPVRSPQSLSYDHGSTNTALTCPRKPQISGKGRILGSIILHLPAVGQNQDQWTNLLVKPPPGRGFVNSSHVLCCSQDCESAWRRWFLICVSCSGRAQRGAVLSSFSSLSYVHLISYVTETIRPEENPLPEWKR